MLHTVAHQTTVRTQAACAGSRGLRPRSECPCPPRGRQTEVPSSARNRSRPRGLGAKRRAAVRSPRRASRRRGQRSGRSHGLRSRSRSRPSARPSPTRAVPRATTPGSLPRCRREDRLRASRETAPRRVGRGEAPRGACARAALRPAPSGPPRSRTHCRSLLRRAHSPHGDGAIPRPFLGAGACVPRSSAGPGPEAPFHAAVAEMAAATKTPQATPVVGCIEFSLPRWRRIRALRGGQPGLSMGAGFCRTRMRGVSVGDGSLGGCRADTMTALQRRPRGSRPGSLSACITRGYSAATWSPGSVSSRSADSGSGSSM